MRIIRDRVGFPSRVEQAAVVKIAIIGGGFSGSMVAVHLLQQATEPLQIELIEPRASCGSGVAYATPLDCHLLNVPAGKMSAFPEEADHFVKWLHRHVSPAVQATDFVPRRWFGTYIQSTLQTAKQHAAPHCRLTHWQEEAIALHPQADQMQVVLRNGAVLTVDRVILALSNFLPSHPAIADPTFYHSPRYVRSVWSGDRLPLAKTDPVLVIGTGLTAIDQVMALHQQRHQGTITLVSRRGLLPQAHQFTKPYQLTVDLTGQTTRKLVRSIRQEMEQAIAQGADWRSVVDALRPITQTVWRSLPLTEKRRFLRHLKPYWEVCRHRIAPQIATVIDDLKQSGQLHVIAGRIQAFEEDTTGVNTVIRQRGSLDVVKVRSHLVLNCTGSECHYQKLDHPLIQNLLAIGLVRLDGLHLGLEVSDDGALIDANGTASRQLYAIGACRKGQLWETTAVPELRVQAVQMAKALLQVSR